MVFSRFFKGKRDASDAVAEREADAEPDASTEPESDNGPDDDAAPEEWTESTLAERAAHVMPTGTSTGSKRPAALYGDADASEPAGPTHFFRAHGCRVETTDGTTLVDCTMALGSVAIGYADPEVTRAVLEAAGAGNASGLPHSLEVDVAERFCEFVPCAEKVQFLKTGAEAMAAAVRIARVYTGRSTVVGTGYFGWHDWCSVGDGVPQGVQRDFRAVPFNDIAALERAVSEAGSGLAAIALEPVVNALPSPEWIARARALADANGAVLICDEMKTGFRLATGGYHEYADVTPDLATFGKALANGFPLAAVCGRAALMDAAARTWISSTYATESTALAAAFVVLELHRERGKAVCEQLAATGKEMQRVVGLALKSSGLPGVTIGGIDPMWFLTFESPEAEALFLRFGARHGALFKRGAYNFASLAHDEQAMLDIEAAASNAFVDTLDAMERA